MRISNRTWGTGPLSISGRGRFGDPKEVLAALVLVAALLLGACGGDAERGGSTVSGGDTSPGLTPEQIEKGIGPVTSVRLETIDEELAELGEEIFETKCSACHKLEDRYVGPALGDVLERRTPEYVMNMILNPEEMLQRHPGARELLGQYMTPMPNQQLTESDARAVLEYLREEAEEHDDDH